MNFIPNPYIFIYILPFSSRCVELWEALSLSVVSAASKKEEKNMIFKNSNFFLTFAKTVKRIMSYQRHLLVFALEFLMESVDQTF